MTFFPRARFLGTDSINHSPLALFVVVVVVVVVVAVIFLSGVAILVVALAP